MSNAIETRNDKRFKIEGWGIRGQLVYGWLKKLMDVSSEVFESELQRSEKRRLATLVVFREAKRRLKMSWRDNTAKNRVIENQLKFLQKISQEKKDLLSQLKSKKEEASKYMRRYAVYDAILGEIFPGEGGAIELDLIKVEPCGDGELARPSIAAMLEKLEFASKAQVLLESIQAESTFGALSPEHQTQIDELLSLEAGEAPEDEVILGQRSYGRGEQQVAKAG